MIIAAIALWRSVRLSPWLWYCASAEWTARYRYECRHIRQR